MDVVGECITTALTGRLQGLASNEKSDLFSVCHIFVVLLVAHSPTTSVMEPDFALRLFQQQIDNFYGYHFKPGQ